MMDNSQHETYLSFLVAGNYYIVPIQKVVYITESSALVQRSVPSESGQSRQVFVFNDEPSTMVRLSQLFGVTSRQEESRKLISMLKQRQQDHINWMNALEESLLNSTPFTKATDPHQCEFGRWYDQYQAPDDELKHLLEKFDEPHQRIHRLADELLNMNRHGEKQHKAALERLNEERHTTLKKLLQYFDNVFSILEGMCKPITIIVSDDDRHRLGIEVDSIGDVVDFDREQFMPCVRHSDRRGSEYIDGFFQGDQQLYISFDLGSLQGGGL